MGHRMDIEDDPRHLLSEVVVDHTFAHHSPALGLAVVARSLGLDLGLGLELGLGLDLELGLELGLGLGLELGLGFGLGFGLGLGLGFGLELGLEVIVAYRPPVGRA
jgi:hypothetical protein